MNYIYSRALAGKSLSTQLSLGTIYQGVISVNNASKTDQEIVSDVLKKDLAIISGEKFSILSPKIGIKGTKSLIGGAFISGTIENIDLKNKVIIKNEI